MRRAAVLFALALLVVLVAAPGRAGETSPFVGHWEGIDLDDSRMIINISEGPDGNVQVFFKDFGASACGLDDAGEPLYAGQVKWLGVIDGDELWTYGRGGAGVGNGALWCMANPPFMLVDVVEEPTLFVTYDAAGDRLTTDFNEWFRVGN